MCLVIFAWLVAQDYFKEMTDNDIRKRIYEEQKNQIEQDMAPFGFIADGFDDDNFTHTDGDRWYTDEYGDRSYMWDYYVMSFNDEIEVEHLLFFDHLENQMYEFAERSKNLLDDFYVEQEKIEKH